MTSFPMLGAPIRLAGVELTNRVVFGPHVTLFATHEGEPTERLGRYYEARARGGVGLIVTGSQHVHPSGGGPRTVRAYDPAAMALWRPVLDACEAHGTKVFAQLSHHGPEAVSTFTEQALWSASAVANPIVGETPKAMSTSEIHEVIEGFAASAANAAAVGFDGVEVKVGHDGLLRSFVSPRSNRRTDEYGGSTANRVRIVTEVLAAILDRVGSAVAVGVRLCLDEHLPGGYGPDEAIEFAQLLGAAGAGWITADFGTWESMEFQIPPMASDHRPGLEVAARVRAATGIPVIASGRIRDPAVAEAALAGGKVDLVALARPLIADPDWVNKALGGAPDSIRPCVACNQLCLGNLVRDLPIGCVHNPAAGREQEFTTGGRPSVRRARVLVVGGGPAGLKTAVTAAEAGHQVVLMEAGDRLGGQVRIASRAPGRREWADIVDHLEAEARRVGVEVHLGRRVGVDDVDGYDDVIVATGARAAPPPFPVEAMEVLDQWRAMASPPRGADVVLCDLGGRYEGAALAETLAVHNRLHWVTPQPWPAFSVDPASAAPLRRSLAARGAIIIAQTAVVAVEASTVITVDLQAGTTARLDPVDLVVMAGNKQAERGLADGLVGHPTISVRVVGDAVAPRDVAAAVLEGARAGRSIGQDPPEG